MVVTASLVAGTDACRRLDSVGAAADSEATTGGGFATVSPLGESATVRLSFSAPNICDKRLFLTVLDFRGSSSPLSSSRAVFSLFSISPSVSSDALSFFSVGGTADDPSFCCATELKVEVLRPPPNKLGVSPIELPVAILAPNKLGAPLVELPVRLPPKKLGVSAVELAVRPPPKKLVPGVPNLNGFGSVVTELNVNGAFAEDSDVVSS